MHSCIRCKLLIAADGCSAAPNGVWEHYRMQFYFTLLEMNFLLFMHDSLKP